MGFFNKIKEGLKKTRDAVIGQIDSMLKSFTKIDDELFEELEELLVMGDVGVPTAEKICEELKKKVKKEGIKNPNEIHRLLEETVSDMLRGGEELDLSTTPSIILVIGVNGVGKTTSIAKLSNLLKKEGKKVLLVAADTFRAGAVEQLDVWAKRIGIDIYMGEENAEPASVIYDATKKFKEGNYDILICDTAGRLHNKKNLMDELEKMNRVLTKNLHDITKNVIMVLDATTGGNGVSQIKSFFKSTNVNGIILTKLDSTAKGGVVFSIVSELNIPILYVGTGETVDDIEKFNIEDFVEAII